MRFKADCEPHIDNFKSQTASFMATGQQVYDQMIERNLELKNKLKKIQTWEEEMQALIDDFDLDLEQIHNIEQFNQNKIEKINSTIIGAVNKENFKIIMEA